MCISDSDDGYLESIAPDVLGALEIRRYFELLDDKFCPVEDSSSPAQCGHSFAVSRGILTDLGLGSVDDVEDVLAVLRSRGGCCDCEVLYNVAEESRLKAKYWKARHAELIADDAAGKQPAEPCPPSFMLP